MRILRLPTTIFYIWIFKLAMKSIKNFSIKIFIIEVHEKKLAIRECEGVFGAWEVSGVKVRVKHNSESKKIISK